MKVCSVENCGKKHKAKGYCLAHYERFCNHGDPLAHIPIKVKGDPICKVEGCERKVCGHGFCDLHYKRFKKYGDPLFSKVRYRHFLDWQIADDGYITKWNGKKHIYQHRHVMEEIIGRKLIKGENVHHINGVKTDNRPENLEIWTSGQPSGQRITDRILWAIKEIEAHYDAAIILDCNLKEKLNSMCQKITETQFIRK